MAEDDENDVAFIQRAFTQAEITLPLQVAPDGQAAIDALADWEKPSVPNQHPLPCLVMLDLKMPRKNGMEVLRWIRGQVIFQSVPVIMFSSSVHPAEIEAAYGAGANAFVTKPSSTQERTELARMIKGFWLTFNQLP